ncbi:SH3-containing GRB2-like protein 3-interacting protein 1 [Heptranchias perlo]|uniref:SH3-containing GRB2-like protein 3-interacting protein 1 n=1 Tax=Heptranchias perlo TaxID=212740 RepID=UPI003559A379
MMEGLKKRTRKAFGIRKKEKDTDSTGSPDRDGSKKSNGAPNGFYAEIDWERYNSPEVDDEGYSIRPDDKSGSTKEKHFYSSSESESEEDTRRKFNVKIRPLQHKDSITCMAASVDELKASVGNISLSPSPMVKSPRRSPAIIKRNLSCEEIARPRRSTPTSEVVGKKGPEDTASLIPLFGPPLESAFEGIKSKAVIDQPEIWGPFQAGDAEKQSSLPIRTFPTGTPPPLPPKNVPATPPRTGSPSAEGSGSDQGEAEPQPDKLLSISDLDDIFGPVLSPRSGVVLSKNKWIDFSDQPARDEGLPVALSEKRPVSAPQPEEVQTGLQSTDVPPSISVPLNHDESEKKSSEQALVKSEKSESSSSLKELAMGQKTTPPPPPPPTYRTVVSSPGPSSGSGVSSSSGSSSPARPATPSGVTSNTPPPPPPRPQSRPKLPSGKPGVTDMSRSFSPPIHSSSPPPVAPLARAESTSSISSTNSLSAATTPTVGKRLSLTFLYNDQPSLVWFDRGKFYLTFDGASRGPSPLTMGAQDTLPVAAAFTETVNTYFKGADPSKCIVKITGEMVLSFPAGITRHFANNQCPAVLTFCITNCSRLEHILPNPQLLCSNTSQGDANTREFWVNMPNLMTHLKKVAEQKPSATYYNVDMLKYQVSSQGIQSTPLNLAVNWRCEPTSTDLRIDYKYNAEAMVTPVALNNVQFLIPVDGGVAKVQAVLPPAAW